MIYSEYSISIIQWGYVVMFAAACPVAPLFAWLANVVEIKSSIWFYTEYSQRMPSRGAEGIGAWLPIVEFVGFMAVISNCMIVYLTLSDKFIENMFSMNVSHGIGILRTVTNNVSGLNVTTTTTDEPLVSASVIGLEVAKFIMAKPASFCFLIIVEHTLVCMKLLLARFIPDKPKWVADKLDHEAWLSQQAKLSSTVIETSLDLTTNLTEVEQQYTVVNDVKVPSLAFT